jgi:hypothetical protein
VKREAQNEARLHDCWDAGGEDPAAQKPLSERQIPQQALLWAPAFRTEQAEAS